MSVATVLQFKPRVGRGFGGGMFAGRIDGYQLVIGAWNGPLAWAAATLWARDLRVGRCSDWGLPTLRELSFLASTFLHTFKSDLHWTSEELADQPSAWGIHFGFPGAAYDVSRSDFVWEPIHWGKQYDGYAIAVRRVWSEAA